MQLGNSMELEPSFGVFDKRDMFSPPDVGYCGSSACSSPEHISQYRTISPAHSNAESVDSAFEDFLDGSLYDSRVSSPARQDLLKPDNGCHDVISSFETEANLDWMSMPMPLDFNLNPDDIVERAPCIKQEPSPFSNNDNSHRVADVKRKSSPEIDFRNLEVILKVRVEQKLQEKMMKCSEQELKLLQNVMLYKQHPQQGVMFDEPLNLPVPLQPSPQPRAAEVPSRQPPPAYGQFDSPTINNFDATLPDDFLAKNCANLIAFINNEDGKFPMTPTEGIMTDPFASPLPSAVAKPVPVTDAKPPTPPSPRAIAVAKPKMTPMVMARSTNKPRLYNFLIELLKNPDRYSCIEWVNREEGVFKFLDSSEVAQLWGHRKNKPNMKYENFARSLRTYIAKGILTKPRNKLVYRFAKSIE